MMEEDDAQEGIGGLVESLAHLGLADQQSLLVARPGSPGRVQLHDAYRHAAHLAHVPSPRPVRTPGMGRTEQALGKGVEALEAARQELHRLRIGEDTFDLFLLLEAADDELLGGTDEGAVDVVIAGDEEEVPCRLQLQDPGELDQEALGLFILLALARPGEIAGDEHEVRSQILAAQAGGVTQERLQRGAAVPAFKAAEVEIREMEPADRLLVAASRRGEPSRLLACGSELQHPNHGVTRGRSSPPPAASSSMTSRMRLRLRPPELSQTTSNEAVAVVAELPGRAGEGVANLHPVRIGMLDGDLEVGDSGWQLHLRDLDVLLQELDETVPVTLLQNVLAHPRRGLLAECAGDHDQEVLDRERMAEVVVVAGIGEQHRVALRFQLVHQASQLGALAGTVEAGEELTPLLATEPDPVAEGLDLVLAPQRYRLAVDHHVLEVEVARVGGIDGGVGIAARNPLPEERDVPCEGTVRGGRRRLRCGFAPGSTVPLVLRSSARPAKLASRRHPLWRQLRSPGDSFEPTGVSPPRQPDRASTASTMYLCFHLFSPTHRGAVGAAPPVPAPCPQPPPLPPVQLGPTASENGRP